MTAVHFDTYSDARSRLKDLLDAAATGRPATVRRDSTQAAVVDAERLRRALARLVPARAEVVAEDGGWSALLPGLPIAADGDTFDEAVDDLVQGLREYAEDWNDHLLSAPTIETTGAWCSSSNSVRTSNYVSGPWFQGSDRTAADSRRP